MNIHKPLGRRARGAGRFVVCLATVFGLAVLLAACGGSSGSGNNSSSTAQGKPTNGGELTFAEQPGSPPDYIFPLVSGADCGNDNITYLQPLLWKPLYWFGHTDSPAATINPRLSMADAPVFSNGGKTVTLTLKHYMWSDGKPVTSRDVLFWMNLLLAEKNNYCGYVPGSILDHVASMSTPNSSTFVIHMNRAYNKTYMLYQGLSLITPIPQQAWDKTSATGKIANYDKTRTGAKAVYSYLNKASESLSTWDTNPLWQVVDGPWHLQPNSGFQVTGQMTMLPNKKYSGPDKPHISKFEELPFTSAEAEFNALQSGTVDYGYVPSTDIGAISGLQSQGMQIKPWYEWGLTSIWFNYSNPRYAPLFNQLYIRQAMEHLINQPEYIKDVLKNYGTPTYGPVPTTPKTRFLSGEGAQNQYPYSVSQAKALLTSHGWRIPSSGAATCQKPGSGAGECGAGISSGTPLSFPLLFDSGFPALQTEFQATQSAFREAGIEISLQQAPGNTVGAEGNACLGETTRTCPSSSVALVSFGSPSYTYVPIYYPSGDTLFACGAVTNSGNYCNHHIDALIGKTQINPTNSMKPMYKLQVALARQVPVLWFPNSAYQISAVSRTVGGVIAQDSTAHIYPQSWWVNK